MKRPILPFRVLRVVVLNGLLQDGKLEVRLEEKYLYRSVRKFTATFDSGMWSSPDFMDPERAQRAWIAGLERIMSSASTSNLTEHAAHIQEASDRWINGFNKRYKNLTHHGNPQLDKFVECMADKVRVVIEQQGRDATKSPQWLACGTQVIGYLFSLWPFITRSTWSGHETLVSRSLKECRDSYSMALQAWHMSMKVPLSHLLEAAQRDLIWQLRSLLGREEVHDLPYICLLELAAILALLTHTSFPVQGKDAFNIEAMLGFCACQHDASTFFSEVPPLLVMAVTSSAPQHCAQRLAQCAQQASSLAGRGGCVHVLKLAADACERSIADVTALTGPGLSPLSKMWFARQERAHAVGGDGDGAVQVVG